MKIHKTVKKKACELIKKKDLKSGEYRNILPLLKINE